MSFERIEPGSDEWTAFFGNHQARYTFAIDQLRSCQPLERVLDAATGVGYGAAQMAAATGARVVAIDRDPHALALAEASFAHSNVTFLKDDCATLAAAANTATSYDAAISFETIEHLPDAASFVRRVGELIRPGGLFVASTPNATVTAAERGAWEHHEREYTAPEFVELLGAGGFSAIRLFGQQLTAIGALRRDIRAEFNRLRSNPVTRLGTWIHRLVRDVRITPALPEHSDDFTFTPIAADDCVRQGSAGPFVIVAVATRGGRP